MVKLLISIGLYTCLLLIAYIVYLSITGNVLVLVFLPVILVFIVAFLEIWREE